jgi:hypothetical protein
LPLLPPASPPKAKECSRKSGRCPGPKLTKGKEQTYTQTNTIAKYDLVDGTRPFDRKKDGFWFGLGIDQLMELRTACLNADRIYLYL